MVKEKIVDDVLFKKEEAITHDPYGERKEIVYFQDDVHGVDEKQWLPEFSQEWKQKIGLAYHAQMRWKMTANDSGLRRLDLIREAGSNGLTLAIEAVEQLFCKEVLDRNIPLDMVYEGMKRVIDRDFKVRTEQITALPYGATSKPTLINLEADLALIELNVDLKKQTGGPTMAWASTFAPYNGTKLADYAAKYGHYKNELNNDVPDTFFDESVLNFPAHWTGPSLKEGDNNWLDKYSLDIYRKQNKFLRNHFNLFCHIPKGDKLARHIIKNASTSKLDIIYIEIALKDHLNKLSREEYNSEASTILEKASKLKHPFQNYFACLPKSKTAIERFDNYLKDSNELYSEKILSNAVRHHLYDEVLYSTQ